MMRISSIFFENEVKMKKMKKDENDENDENDANFVDFSSILFSLLVDFTWVG